MLGRKLILMPCRALLISIGFVTVLGGCAHKPSAANGDTTGIALSARNRLPNTDNGLEIRRWTVQTRPSLIAPTIARYSDPSAIEPAMASRLSRNGFSLARIPIDQLGSLLNDLGGATVDANEWHGQVPQWRSLEMRLVPPGGQALAIDGRVRRFDRGEFNLFMRSWTVQMEYGPTMHVEIVPEHRLPQINNLRRLLGEQTQSGEGFAGASLDLLLESGYGFIVWGETPQAPAPHKSDAQRRGNIGAFDSVGPAVSPPPTLGELLLAPERTPPSRDILILIPKIAPELFVPTNLTTIESDH
ncbi:MAG: hypothetical protein L0Y44_09780 [Phycisphaerales bacterium]|nr:hypothetical protein [Phycisphaerales bacterium]MCI0630927.1 hypothetical protein [Phycisphaerales bacterium]MCI0674248.1 hypothetical protein [Phycisphaerales bacterium]